MADSLRPDTAFRAVDVTQAEAGDVVDRVGDEAGALREMDEFASRGGVFVFAVFGAQQGVAFGMIG